MTYPGYPNDQSNPDAAIPVYITNGSSDGSATAANQVLEIAQLTAINANTTGVATAANQTLELTELNEINANTTGSIKTPFITLATTTGTVAAGFKSVTFQAITGTFSISGVTFPASATVAGVTWQTTGADTLAAISYTVAASSSVLITGF